MTRRSFTPGDPVPWFTCRSSNSDKFHFEAVAGRYLVLCFFGSAGAGKTAAAMTELASVRAFFDDRKLAFFGVSIDPQDEALARVKEEVPGIRYFWDFDRKLSLLYGALDADDATGDRITYHPFTLLLDPSMRVIAHLPMLDPKQHARELGALLKNLPAIADHAGVTMSAPVLVLPRVFEPEFCRRLIDLYEAQGGEDSGFMRESGGKTVGILDYGFKRRKDFTFDRQPEFEPLRIEIRERLNRRLVPEIRKAFQFRATHIERYIVACYEGEVGGFFRAHRDNTTKATAHRQFACTLNLNAEEYEGGNLRFPEFGPQTYRAPTGGAVVFSCSLLHEATPVTRGRRYAFLPFLYGGDSAQIRKQNRQFLSGKTIDQNKST